MRHEGRVQSASFSPDGTRVLTASCGNTARLWDVPTGKPVGEPIRNKFSVYSASFSPDGKRVVTTGDGNSADLWDAATGKPIGELIQNGPGRIGGETAGASFSSDGRRVVTRWSNTAQLWDWATGKPVGVPMRHDYTVSCASFSPDGRCVVTASNDGTARLWDAATGKPMGEPMRDEPRMIGGMKDASFSPNGRRVVTASWDGTARLWDAATGMPLTNEQGVANGTQRNMDADRHSFASTTVNPDDINFLAGKRINEDGEAVDIPQSEITAWRLKLLAQPDARDDAWNSLVRWKLSDPSTRTITYHGTITAPEHIEREITWALSHLDATKKNPGILSDAYDLDPGSPLIHLALAAVEENEVSREFLIGCGLKRLAAAEAVCDKAAHQAFAGTYRAKAAITLYLLGDRPRAAQVFAGLVGKHDAQRRTWGSPAWIEKLDDFEWPNVFRQTLHELAK